MKKIWIIDDDHEMVSAMQLMLELLDCQVEGFMSAPNTVQALMDGQLPDLILLDINMPEISGMDFLEFLRRRKEWKHLPVVMLSTEAADVTIDQAIALGADGYITKPVTIEELEAALEGALSKTKKD